MSFFRLVEGIISIARPTQPLGNAAFNGTYGPATDRMFDFSKIRKDIHLEVNQPVVVKLNSPTAPPVPLGAGIWDFEGEWADKIYITTTVTTEIDIYANG